MYREEYNTIVGQHPDGRCKAIHFERDGKNVVACLDMKQPVTLKRMQELVVKLKQLTGIEFPYLSVNHTVFEYECSKEVVDEYLKYGDSPPYTKPIDKAYTYYAKENRLIIWDKGELVYENANGVITRDPVALADTYL